MVTMMPGNPYEEEEQDPRIALLQNLQRMQQMQQMPSESAAPQNAFLNLLSQAGGRLGTLGGVAPVQDTNPLDKYTQVLAQAAEARKAGMMNGLGLKHKTLQYLSSQKDKKDIAGAKKISDAEKLKDQREHQEYMQTRNLEGQAQLEGFKNNLNSTTGIPNPAIGSFKPNLPQRYGSPQAPQIPQSQGMGEIRAPQPMGGVMEEEEERPSGRPRSKGQEAADIFFAKEVLGPSLKGRHVSEVKAIKDLKRAQTMLNKQKETGGIVGMLPDKLRGLVDEDQQAIKDAVGSAVKESLRTILGGQFSQEEGESVFRFAYNPVLGKKENLIRIKALAESLTEQMRAKDRAIKYWEKWQTLDGFKGNVSMRKWDVYNNIVDDFETKGLNDAEDATPPEMSSNPDIKMPLKDSAAMPKKFYSPSRNQTKLVYPDGREEIVSGKR